MNNQESSRSWPETMKAGAEIALRDRSSGDEKVIPGTQATGWDPGEVWLSRIKQPRDRAATRAIR